MTEGATFPTSIGLFETFLASSSIHHSSEDLHLAIGASSVHVSFTINRILNRRN
jgi:hypothetical protein